MAYRGRSRRSGPPRPGRWMDLRYAGTCQVCGKTLPAGTRAFYDPADRSVTCTDLVCADAVGLTKEEWRGSPISGGYVTVLSDTRIGGPPAVTTVRFSSGATFTRNSRGRCIDAPCCGCCTI